MKRARRILGHGPRGLGNTDGEKVKSADDANAKRDLRKYNLAISCVSEAVMCNDSNRNASSSSRISPDPSKFFPAINKNLTKIVWAHAVNSQAELGKALASGRSIATLSFLRSSFFYCTREMERRTTAL